MTGTVRLEILREVVSGKERNGGLGTRPLMSVGIGDGAHEGKQMNGHQRCLENQFSEARRAQRLEKAGE